MLTADLSRTATAFLLAGIAVTGFLYLTSSCSIGQATPGMLLTGKLVIEDNEADKPLPRLLQELA